MSTIIQLYEAVAELKMRDKLPDLIQATSFEILVLNQTQMQEGMLSTDIKIEPSYKNAYYARKKEEQNAAPGYGVPDLFKTGAYYKGMGVAVTDKTYDIESNVPYAHDDSIMQYGDDLLRLSDENKTLYIEDDLAPAIQEYITLKTGLIFA